TLTEVAEAYGLPVSEALGELAARMSAFTSAIAYPNGEFPPFGDTLHPRPNKLAELAQAYSPVAEVGPDRFFSHAGYAVLRSGEPGVSARQIGMICSSLETTHKHEDNLSFTFWADGIEWLTDPGLYGYNIEDEHGAYFRSAAAHSALVIEGQRYEADTGSAQMISWRGDREVAHVQAEHSAYPGVRMLRTLLLDKVQDAIFVADSCETNEQPGALELWFHAGAGVSAEVYPDGAVTLSAAGRPDAWSIVPLAPASTDVEVFSGATDPQLSGWIYPPNGPAPTRSIRFRSGDDRVWLTAIVPGPAPAGDRVEALRQLYNDHAGRLGLRS
ncbi:MAG: hypothetical protein QOJ29_913, partial [Thermoleophilaceae bacterium]|nr:hypothetical protein [Thermoleophilaceae bacterium]